MKKTILLTIASLFVCIIAFASRISGHVSDDKGNALGFASVFIKGGTLGTTANNQGNYYLDLQPGTYTVYCQYVGYGRVEKKITVADDAITVDFVLAPLQTT